MKPQSVPTDGLLLFQAHFDQQLNLEHPLIKLANQIDWEAFDRQFGEHYCEVILAAAGANLRKLLRLLPCAQPIRLLADLLSRFARYHHMVLLIKVA